MAADDPFYKAVLQGIGAPITSNNLTFLYAWRQAEGASATYNPFNTTWNATGSTVYNSHGVRNYVSAATGVDATVKTLLMDRYASIVKSLEADASPLVTAAALTTSEWGTGPLATSVLLGYAAGASPKPPAIAVPEPVFVPATPAATAPAAPPSEGDTPGWLWMLESGLVLATVGVLAYGLWKEQKLRRHTRHGR
jgi:hypothetical protein